MFTSAVTFESKAAVLAPSVEAARVVCIPRYPAFLKPFFQGLGNAKRTMQVASFIVVLFRRVCPSNITGFVMSIIVDAVQRCFTSRTPPQAGQELFERLKLKANASPVVQAGISVVWLTTVLGSYISPILDRNNLIALFAVLSRTGATHLPIKTATRLGAKTTILSLSGWVSEISHINPLNSAAIATTPPPALTGIADDKQAGEALPFQISKARVVCWFRNELNGRIRVSHIKLLNSLVWSGLCELLAQFRKPFLFYHATHAFAR